MFGKRKTPHIQIHEREALLQLLRPVTHSGTFAASTVSNWYAGREFILRAMESNSSFGANGVAANDFGGIHVTAAGTSSLVMAALRQLALSAHFLNYEEDTHANRTVITLLYNRTRHPDIVGLLRAEENLCHLPDYCKITLRSGDDTSVAPQVINGDSYLDVELDLVGFPSDDFSAFTEIRPQITAEAIEEFVQANPIDQSVDTSMARYINMVYNVGADIDNLPPYDPNNVSNYTIALNYFAFQQKKKEADKCWGPLPVAADEERMRDNGYQLQLRNRLSNVACSDCIALRLKSIIRPSDRALLGMDTRSIPDAEALTQVLNRKQRKVMKLLQRDFAVLARSEHLRWCTEKLILGFRPFSDRDLLEDSRHFGDDRKAFRRSLKPQFKHVNLCSYRDLRRIDPANMKTDCFLMMAMPEIWLKATSR